MLHTFTFKFFCMWIWFFKSYRFYLIVIFWKIFFYFNQIIRITNITIFCWSFAYLMKVSLFFIIICMPRMHCFPQKMLGQICFNFLHIRNCWTVCLFFSFFFSWKKAMRLLRKNKSFIDFWLNLLQFFMISIHMFNCWLVCVFFNALCLLRKTWPFIDLWPTCLFLW